MKHTFSSDNNNGTGDTSGSNSGAPDGGVIDNGGSGSTGSGGGNICYEIVVITPCSCRGHTYERCTCAADVAGGTNPTFTVYEIECASKSFQQKGNDDCPQDTNGNCPEDDGYVGVNTADTEVFDEQIFIDDDFKNNECLKSVYDSSGKASTFQSYLQNFEPEFSVAHLRFRYDENYKTTYDSEFWGALAVTGAPQNFNINITFNGDSKYL